jgi:hypothetical protein
MKRIITILSACWILNGAFGQIQEDGTPESYNFPNMASDPLPTFSCSFDTTQITADNDSAYDVGVAEIVNINFVSQSSKVTTSNGIKVYRYLIEVQNALGLGVEFNSFYLPVGSTLYAYNEDQTILLGAYTSNNNPADGKFSIQPISGTKLVLEYNQPSEIDDDPLLNINRISKIYRPIFGDEESAQQRTSNCYQNVHCVSDLEVDRSVMKWLFYDTDDESYYVCSCALVNQDVSPNDLKPYVLTANHCGKNADLSTAIFYFNFQHSTCTGSNANQYNYTLTGGTKRAKRAVYDMYLLELYSFPPPDYNVHLAGWDRSNRSSLPDEVMGIHHPHGQPKKISLGTFAANTNPNFWRVEWDRNDAPTAPGSSGSPLFEEDDDKIIGWLSYGTSECDKLDGIDRYGKFGDTWSAPYGADQRLKDWLDPNNYDNDELLGRDPCFTNLVINNRTFYSAQLRYQPENKVTVQAGNTLETVNNVIIVSGSEHKFTAGQQIALKTGFQAVAGSDFTAVIEPCELVARGMANGNESIYNASAYHNSNIHELHEDDLDLKVQTSVFAFPNPAGNYTNIEYSLAKDEEVSIEVYNMMGVCIATLVRLAPHNRGIYQVGFNMNNLAAGQYICVLKTSSTFKNCKIIKTD